MRCWVFSQLPLLTLLLMSCLLSLSVIIIVSFPYKPKQIMASTDGTPANGQSISEWSTRKTQKRRKKTRVKFIARGATKKSNNECVVRCSMMSSTLATIFSPFQIDRIQKSRFANAFLLPFDLVIVFSRIFTQFAQILLLAFPLAKKAIDRQSR